MGPGTLIAVDVAGESLTDMGLVSGWMNLIPFVVSGIAVSVVAGNGYTTERLSRRQKFARAAMGAGSGVVVWAITMGANLLLATPVAGAVATLVVSVFWLRYVRGGRLATAP